MQRWSPRILCSIAITVTVACAFAAPAKRKRPDPDKPGVFDYYLLSLSWSPEYCAGPSGSRDRVQCGEGRRFGFVVHGLWPQYERGYPDSCAQATRVPDALVNAMLPLMPSSKLIQHEWEKHGTCSGVGVDEYFQKIQKAFAAVKVPEDFRGPITDVEVAPADVKRKFEGANPTFPAAAIRIQCSGRYLSEVRVCLTKDLKGRACSTDVKDTCRGSSIIMRPVR